MKKKAAEAAAAANRAKFGEAKSEKILTRAQAQSDAKHLDGHKLAPQDKQ